MGPAATHLFLQEERNLVIDLNWPQSNSPRLRNALERLHVNTSRNVSCPSAKGRNVHAVLTPVKQEL